MTQPASAETLHALTEQLLERDRNAHERALAELADVGDARVVPHLIEIAMVDRIANNWERFGFPDILRDRGPPRYFELPEVRWPGVIDALRAIAEPDFDSEIAWVEWEGWYSQQDITPLEGFTEWKIRFYRSFVPPVGSLLDVEPRAVSVQDVRYANTDRSYLAALNHPTFVPADEVTVKDDAVDDDVRYLHDAEIVYGFELAGQTYAVPRMILFPHEFMNATLEDRPVMLTWCTLCNAPILYDRRVNDRELTFGNSGLLWQGNKIMYDEETESLWAHHSGKPIAGHYLEQDATLDVIPVSQTTWGEWVAENPNTLVPHPETGFDYDYTFYDGYVGFFEHYWEREDISQPGLQLETDGLAEKTPVYGIASADETTIHVYPLDIVEEHEPIEDTIDDRRVVVVSGVDGDDVAVYEAPDGNVEREGVRLRDAGGREWRITRDGLVAGDDRLERIPGRRGLWFAFRSQYDDHRIVQPADV